MTSLRQTSARHNVRKNSHDRKKPNGDLPDTHESAYVDRTARSSGKINIHKNVFNGPYAEIRAGEVNEDNEMGPAIIGAHSNSRDGVVIHSKAGGLVKIGEHTSIAHRSIVHGPCVVGAAKLPASARLMRYRGDLLG